MEERYLEDEGLLMLINGDGRPSQKEREFLESKLTHRQGWQNGTRIENFI